MLFDNFLSLAVFMIISFLFCDTVYRIAVATCLVMAHRSIDTEIYSRKEMNLLNNNRIKELLPIIIILLLSSVIPVFSDKKAPERKIGEDGLPIPP